MDPVHPNTNHGNVVPIGPDAMSGCPWTPVQPNVNRVWKVIIWLAMGLIAMVVGVNLILLCGWFAAPDPPRDQTIQAICSGSVDPSACEDICSRAPIDAHENPKELAAYMIHRVLAGVSNSSLHVSRMLDRSENSGSCTHQNAWDVCIQVLDRAQDQLIASLALLSKVKFEPTSLVKTQLEDVQTWLSASKTFHDTCFDQLPRGANGSHVKELYSVLLSCTSYLNLAASLSAQLPEAGFLSSASRKLLHIQPSEHSFPSSTPSQPDRFAGLLLEERSSWTPNVTVDPAGTTSLQDALNAAPRNSASRYVIKITAGQYQGPVNVASDLTNIVFIGAGIDQTVITGDLSSGTGSNTYASATLAIDGEGFIGTGFTVKNTAGPANGQAVAMRVSGDKCAFHEVKVTGFQDTLYPHTMRQFYSKCEIEGTIDFVFGNAAALFQDCKLSATAGLDGQGSVFTAQGRTDPNQNTGFVFQNCNITSSATYSSQIRSEKSYLGRPWKNYSRVVYFDSNMDNIIEAEGWLPWDGNAPETLFFAEFRNTGPGADTSNRVKWAGVHQFNSESDVTPFLADQFISASSWLPDTTLEYYGGFKPTA